jgi:hypothetical protein
MQVMADLRQSPSPHTLRAMDSKRPNHTITHLVRARFRTIPRNFRTMFIVGIVMCFVCLFGSFGPQARRAVIAATAIGKFCEGSSEKPRSIPLLSLYGKTDSFPSRHFVTFLIYSLFADSAIVAQLMYERSQAGVAALGEYAGVHNPFALTPEGQRRIFAAMPQKVLVANLRLAMLPWTHGPMPLRLKQLLAVSSPRDVTDAVLQEGDATRHSVVIDVGANGGWPVTRLGLERTVGHVLSIEPDSRNFVRLIKLQVPNGSATRYVPYKGAAARNAGKQMMSFHKSRDDFTCFTCLNTSGSKPEVYQSEVDVYTVVGTRRPSQDRYARI